MVFKLKSWHYFVTEQLLTNTTTTTNGHLKDRRTLTVYVCGCRFTCENGGIISSYNIIILFCIKVICGFWNEKVLMMVNRKRK